MKLHILQAIASRLISDLQVERPVLTMTECEIMVQGATICEKGNLISVIMTQWPSCTYTLVYNQTGMLQASCVQNSAPNVGSDGKCIALIGTQGERDAYAKGGV